jgi:hypothetical protein
MQPFHLPSCKKTRVFISNIDPEVQMLPNQQFQDCPTPYQQPFQQYPKPPNRRKKMMSDSFVQQRFISGQKDKK